MNDCQCERMELRRLDANGAGMQYKMQCLDCGKTGPAISHASLTDGQKQGAPPVDHGIREAYWQQRRETAQAQWKEERTSRVGEWWQRYREYMVSPEWDSRRQMVLSRDRMTCQACLSRPATQVHHLTYKHLGNEPLFELISVCAPCHERITELDSIGAVTQ